MIAIKGYTEEELNYIENNFVNQTVKQLANHLGKTYGSITNALRKMNLIKQPHKPWSKEEDDYLIEHYIDMTSEELANKFGRTVHSINARRDDLGLIRNATWSDDEVAFLINNYLTMEHCEIGKALNRTQGAVTAKCFELGLYKKELPWEQWEIDYIKDNYQEMTKNEIAEILNRSPSAIGLKASRMGFKKYPYYCNYHFFDVIDSEEKAYWLGFLTADGWISKNEETGSGCVGIELQYGDIDHLKKFNKSIEGNYQITDRWRPCLLSTSDKEKKHHTCVIRIFSIKMYEDLCRLGFSENKSYDVQMPNIDPSLLRHYIRGYFDGDGCLYVSNNHLTVKFVTASENYFNNLVNLLAKLDINVRCAQKTNEYNTIMYYIDIRFNKDKLKFLDYIYENSNISLDRKYKKYLKAKSIYGARVGLAS
jgi:metal-sulfur cluster biosynthetic enzyme